jgi:pimeloyl-ACP methyl ester carboxylesterase
MRPHSKGRRKVRAYAALAVLGVVAGLGPLASAQASASVSAASVVDLPVAFRVTNVNDSKVSCNPGALGALGPQFATDGQQYTVVGRLVGPRSALEGAARSATVYLHGTTAYKNFIFDAVPGHNYALQMAQLGHVSVVVEGLGYGANGVGSSFNGNNWCWGAQAQVIHQIIGELRNGAYTIDGNAPAKAFSRVAIAGHSGGEIAVEIEAYSWHDADAVALLSYVGNPTQIPEIDSNWAAFIAACTAGGDPRYPSGYAFFWLTPDVEAQDIFYDQANPLIAFFKQDVRPDPCGLLSNLGDASATDPATGKPYADNITVPTLLLWGDRDKLCPAVAADGSNCRDYANNFKSSAHETTVVEVCKTPPYDTCGSTHSGHELVLEDDPAARAFRVAMNDWLTTHGF